MVSVAELHYHTIGGYAGVRIYPERGLYETIEPHLSKEEKAEAEALKDAVLELTRLRPHQFGSNSIKTLGAMADSLLHELLPDSGAEKRKTYKYYLLRDFAGAGMLEPMLRDERVEEVHCAGAGIPMDVKHKDFGTLKTNRSFPDRESVDSHARRALHTQGIKTSLHPAGGFTIEKQKKGNAEIAELVESKALPKELIAHAWLAIEKKESLLICGGDEETRSALLSAISLLIPPFRKIISIEHERSLKMPHKNWTARITHGGYGPADSDGKRLREVTFDEILKDSLEKKPDHLILRECTASQLIKCGGGFIATTGQLSLSETGSLPKCMLLNLHKTGKRYCIREASIMDGKQTKICEWDNEKGYVFHEDIHAHTRSEKQDFEYKMRALKWIEERGFHPPFFGIFSDERETARKEGGST